MASAWPKALQDAGGPMRADKLDGAALGMGEYGAQTRALAEEGLVPPDMLTGLTLYILGHQPRGNDRKQRIPGAGGGVAGGVWVRERFTLYRPLERDDAFTVRGHALGRHVHKGRRYGTNGCSTWNQAGELVARNLTTGLLAYAVDEGLVDQIEGENPDEIDVPGADHSRAADNPCLPALQSMREGQVLGGDAVYVSLALMEARDTKKPDNPIHSDPELAKKAGLARPIAGGSHVLAFVLEPLLAAAGRHALYYGAAFDVRWKAPVYADTTMVPEVRVRAADEHKVVFDLSALLPEDDPGQAPRLAMTGQVTVPLR